MSDTRTPRPEHSSYGLLLTVAGHTLVAGMPSVLMDPPHTALRRWPGGVRRALKRRTRAAAPDCTRSP